MGEAVGPRGEAVGIRLENVTKRFRGGVVAVDRLDLEVRRASSSCSSVPPGAGSPRCCGWSPGWRR